MPLAVVVCCLMSFALLKSVALMNAVRWAAKRARGYERESRLRPPRNDLELAALFERHGGDFFPFGAKWYKVRRLYSPGSNDSRLTKARKSAVRLIAKTFISGAGFILVSYVSTIALNALAPKVTVFASVVVSALTLWVVAYNMGLLAEAVAWYLAVGRYARSYFTAGITGRRPEDGSVLDELIVFVTLAVFMVLSLAVSVSTLQLRFGGFKGMSRDHGFVAELRRLADSTYYVVANVTTLGDSSVQLSSAPAKIGATTVLVAGLLLLTFTLALFSSVILERQLPDDLGRKPRV
ncbi:hypothetical protein ACGF3C_11040 [Micromonospora sp. NPDC047762]|uniref:hypothetical protein n=1 Tax=Micromonospora sp. NPDC047762 TaxID=3364255 RepID=UPI0037146E25